MKLGSLNIVADENIPALRAFFGPLGSIRTLAGRSMTSADLQDADVLLVRSITSVDKTLLDGTRVGFVGTATIGTDHIDLAYLDRRGIPFSSAPGCNADAVVEYVLTVLYGLAAEQGFRLLDKAVGIVGVGNVGSRLAQRLEKLGVRLLLNDPPRAQRGEAGFVELDALLYQADIICLHTPLVTSGPCPTQHLLGPEQLARLRPNALVVNAGRGAAIDGAALLAVTEQRSDLTLVLDVWEGEPGIDPALVPRVRIATPHIAGYTLDGKIRGTYMLYQALCRHVGLPDAGPLQDYLPQPPVCGLTLGTGAEPLELMRLLYDPWRDDRALRATLCLPDAERRLAFDRLRKEYPVRREFATLRLTEARDPVLANELAALGFAVDLA